MSDQNSDYDSPWKEAAERYFPALMEWFFPHAYAQIDWERGYEFMDKELQEVVRDAAIGRKLVDKLVKVWLIGGDEAWAFVHLEAQAQKIDDFEERMYVCNYRVFDRYKRPVASMGILGDTVPGWRPDRYGYEILGFKLNVQFPIVKLLDYEQRWVEMEASTNPFAVLTMAHLKTQATARDPESRAQWKLRIVKGMYEHRFAKADIVELFRYIDWMMVLPPELDKSFDQSIQEYEEEKKVAYVTGYERRAMDRGGLKVARESVLDILQARFQQVPQAVAETVAGMEDMGFLKELHIKAALAASLDEFQQSITR